MAADGAGFSLVPLGSAPASDQGARWRASAQPGGSPGTDDPPFRVPGVVINEVLTAPQTTGFGPDPAFAGPADAIELFNPTASPVDLSGWFLTDDAREPRKFRIPDGTLLPRADSQFSQKRISIPHLEPTRASPSTATVKRSISSARTRLAR